MIGNCYSFEHIAEDHIHTEIACNIVEPQQKYRHRSTALERPVIDYWGLN